MTFGRNLLLSRGAGDNRAAASITGVVAALLLTLAPAALTGQTPTDSPSRNTLKVFDASLVDTAIDPCQNFYRYACNGWLKKNPLPKDQTTYGRFTELADINREKLRLILESTSSASSTRTPNEQKIGDEYATCMDVAAVNARGTAPFQPELDRIAALREKRDLPVLLAELHRQGVDAFFASGSNQDFADSTRVIDYFVASGLGLPERDYYTRTDAKSVEQRNQYVLHVANMFRLLGEPAGKASQDAQTVMALETRLARASLTVTEARDPQKLNHPMKLAAFEASVPAFDFNAYLAALHAPLHNPETDGINVTEPKFFTEMNALLNDTDLAAIKTYLRWHFIHAIAGTSTPQSFDDEDFNFYAHTLRGQEEQQPRWKRCTRRVDSELGEALGQVYVSRYFPASEKQRALDMTVAIEAAMGRDIDNLDWMSAATKLRAREKLHTVVNKIGYPDKWRDYSRLEIVRGDTLGNMLRAREFESDRDLAKIGKPVDRAEWGMTPPTVNAYYNPQMNDVNFPAGYLQPPFFSALEDDAANYGDMGSTIGHELTHGFDDEGRQFDASGNLTDWWTAQDGKKFTERATCMVRQFNGYVPVDNVHINGKLTLGENLADLGGLWLAYLAWTDEAQKNHLDMAAKQDGYTAEQRFFVAYAQQWCTQTRPEALRTQLQTDPHSPDEYRTNGILADLPQFARTFHCRKGQPMAAEKTCRVW
ncbi:MAG TPA: M13 family metallopeptidase [Acidisarcina sp.]|nr:M13 family metallopeptidase [Acidisarcina sp.]